MSKVVHVRALMLERGGTEGASGKPVLEDAVSLARSTDKPYKTLYRPYIDLALFL
jgi:hypothetical protein